MFPSKDQPAGGFAEVLARDPRLARVYAALSSMGARAAAALVRGADLRLLIEKHSELIYAHASAFALQGSGPAVPGGPSAEHVWGKLVGVPTANPTRFFRALIEKDDGKLLAYFDLLAQLDLDHQRFFTLNPVRATRFTSCFAIHRYGAGRGSAAAKLVIRRVPSRDSVGQGSERPVSRQS